MIPKLLPAVLWLIALAGCAATEPVAVERLDPRTAVHTTLMPEPWVYYRDAPMLAAHLRDYLNVGVLQTNRAGARAWWLGVVAWSTLDRNAAAAGAARPTLPARLRLAWDDGSALELLPAAGGRKAVGLTEPAFEGEALAFDESWFSLSPPQLARLAQAPPTRVALIDDQGRPLAYEAWHAPPEALAALLEATGGSVPSDVPRR